MTTSSLRIRILSLWPIPARSPASADRYPLKNSGIRLWILGEIPWFFIALLVAKEQMFCYNNFSDLIAPSAGGWRLLRLFPALPKGGRAWRKGGG